MDPATLSLLKALGISFAPTLFGGALNRSDPQRKARDRALGQLTPANIKMLTDQLFPILVNTPGFQLANRFNTANAARVASTTNTGLSASGNADTGVGRLFSTLASSQLASGKGRLYADANKSAMDSALQLAVQRAGVFGQSTPGDATRSLGSAGLNAFLPFLLKSMTAQKQGDPASSLSPDILKAIQDAFSMNPTGFRLFG